MLLVLLAPLAVMAVMDDPEPQLRIASTWDHAAVLIVDGDARALVINTNDRELARAVTGRLARPWEPRPLILIAPASDRAAIGLLEALQQGEPGMVVVAGTPGADPLWDAIERECWRRGVTLTYLTGRTSIDLGRVSVDVAAPEPDIDGERVVVVTRGATRVVIALDGGAPEEPGNVLVTGGGVGAHADLVITTEQASRASSVHEIVVGTRDIVRVSLETSTIRVTGGTPRVPASEASP
ncbi:MAG TPA: hypothetical protein VMM78_11405 [Thermomicrobiales bacterium]|nr:hypothetical protein [Thermomicrobiales bacterium]